MFLTRTRPSHYMGIAMMLWAVVSALTAVVKNFHGLLLVRFFLGVTEAPYYPGAVYLLSIFYTRKEIATRIAILYTGNILATAFAGLIAAGIFHGLDDVAGLSGWKWLFILQGAVTFAIAVVGFFCLPDTPLTTRWLNPEERQLAHDRMERDTVGNQGHSSTWQGFKQAAVDPNVWLFAFMAHMHLAANGFKNFFPTVVATLGASTILVSWNSGRMNERTWHITISKAVAVIGFVGACATLNLAGRYVCMVIFTIGTYAVNSLILGWCGSTCGQTKEKKAVAIGIVTTVMNASFIWTPYLWPKSDEPRYMIALLSSAAFSIATAATAWVVKFIMMRKNKKLRQSEDEVTTFYFFKLLMEQPTLPRATINAPTVNENSLYVTGLIPGKGQGFIITTKIPSGTRILCESLVFKIPAVAPSSAESFVIQKLQTLSRDQQRAVLALRITHAGTDRPFTGIMGTNALPLGSVAKEGGLLLEAARMNHACKMNARYSWNTNLEKLTVHAVKDIGEGEEITISYLGKTANYATRQQGLKSKFDFDCGYEMCSLPLARREQGDQKMDEIPRLGGLIGDRQRIIVTPVTSLHDAHTLLRLLEEEEIAHARMARAYSDAMQIAISNGDQPRAKVFAERAYAARVICQAEDSPQAIRLRGLAERPAQHELYGMSRIWEQDVEKIPQGLDEREFEDWLWRKGE
ncbi:hypothetical protein H2199_008556 [Coniosporium tulheliwenetii]|uniref:Uncharacterized protein n=1 Tax=Coniosporium tulheliwenetii TaxID=3383036 RepID=A0ACC2YII4_9PEZI|nr:hypothetical protein H2199_008556 [Cladosporium sp. JES 115]